MDASAYADARNFEIKNRGYESEIPIDLIRRLAHIHCTEPEIYNVLGVSMQTWHNWKNQNVELCKALEEGYAEGKKSIRRAQFEVAFPDPDNGYRGNPNMLIWLGKNILKQSDKISIGGDNDNPVKIKLTWGDPVKPDSSDKIDNVSAETENP